MSGRTMMIAETNAHRSRRRVGGVRYSGPASCALPARWAV